MNLNKNELSEDSSTEYEPFSDEEEPTQNTKNVNIEIKKENKEDLFIKKQIKSKQIDKIKLLRILSRR
tara:strand:+ start:428 stop:631 length:204 start_codon:yes stop_codon:yes gene_type:complete